MGNKIPWDHVFWKKTEQGRTGDQRACLRPLLPPPLIRSWRDMPPTHRGQRLISESSQRCLRTSSLQQGKSWQVPQAPSAVWKHSTSLRHLPASQTDAYCLWPQLGCWHHTRTSPYRSHSLHFSWQMGREAVLNKSRSMKHLVCF